MKKGRLISRLMLQISCAGVLFFYSCSPKITSFVPQEFPPLHPDSVRVYEEGDGVPGSAYSIGRVSVTDRGLTAKCNYAYMLGLAVKETAKKGGNGLYVNEHRYPNFWRSTCHEVFATMLRIPDFTVDSTDIYDGEKAIEQEMQLRKAYKDQVNAFIERHRVPSDMIKLSVGPAWITSRVTTATGDYKNKIGTHVALSYVHYWRYGHGFGGIADYSYTLYPDASSSRHDDSSVNLLLFAPTYSYSQKIVKGWIWEVGLGIGLAICSNRFSQNIPWGGFQRSMITEAGVGLYTRLSTEYMFSKHWGAGIELSSTTLRFAEPDGYKKTNTNESYGFNRFSVLGGFRFYF